MYTQRFKLIYVVTHRLADVDAYCATYAIVKLLCRITKDSTDKAVFPDGLNTITMKVSKKFPMYIIGIVVLAVIVYFATCGCCGG